MVGLLDDIFTDHDEANPVAGGCVAEPESLRPSATFSGEDNGGLCSWTGDDVDGELAVDDVVVVGDEENSDCEDILSTSSR